MGYFLDYLLGGNIKVAASSLAGLYHHNIKIAPPNTPLDVIYLATFTTRAASLGRDAIAKQNFKTVATIDLLRRNMLKNFVDLAVLDLSINAAPVEIPYEQTHNDFSESLTKYFIAKKIPERFITSDNRSLTEPFAANLNGNGGNIKDSKEELQMYGEMSQETESIKQILLLVSQWELPPHHLFENLSLETRHKLVRLVQDLEESGLGGPQNSPSDRLKWMMNIINQWQ